MILTARGVYVFLKGSKIIETADQDETDFTKSLRILTNLTRDPHQAVDSIVALGSHAGDRFDHVMGNLQTLYKAQEMTSLPVYLLGNHSIEFLLQTVSSCCYLCDFVRSNNWVVSGVLGRTPHQCRRPTSWGLVRPCSSWWQVRPRHDFRFQMESQ